MAQNVSTPRIVGLGNALVDVLAQVGHNAVERHALTPGGMHLVDSESAEALFREVGPGLRQCGGSVANSIAHIRAEGVAATYLGKVAADELGDSFAEEFATHGIDFPAPRLENGLGTGRCVVLVTPDGERTMSTFLGAAQALAPADVEAAMPATFDMLMVEGYLWDSPEGAATIAAAVERAKAAGARVALTPSDSGCVERNRKGMLDFIASGCDILVGNEDEFGALSGEETPAAMLGWAASKVSVAAVTMSEKGSIVTEGGETHRIAADPVAKLVDTTGAGDAYAAGLLAGLARGQPAAEAAHEGARIAARVVQHEGARERVEDAKKRAS